MNGFMEEHFELNFVNHLITKAPGLQRMKTHYHKARLKVGLDKWKFSNKIIKYFKQLPRKGSGYLIGDAKIYDTGGASHTDSNINPFLFFFHHSLIYM